MLNTAQQKMMEQDSVTLDGVVYLDPTHIVMTNQTHLNLLADIFDSKDGIYSIGDGLLALGDWLSAFCVYVWIVLVVRKIWRS